MGDAPATDDLAYRVLTSIRRIIRRVTTHSHRLAHDTGLTVPQLLVLRAIDTLGADATLSRLVVAVQLSPSTVSGVVERLVKAGLVTRTQSERDRRVWTLAPSPAGRERLATVPLPLQDAFLARLAALPDAERDAILSALEQVVELMDAGDLDASPVLVDGADVGPPK
ncbi:MAG: MarR family transcriptional regulator [Myxococcota bacterium]